MNTTIKYTQYNELLQLVRVQSTNVLNHSRSGNVATEWFTYKVRLLITTTKLELA
jgi:hypothetical protein